MGAGVGKGNMSGATSGVPDSSRGVKGNELIAEPSQLLTDVLGLDDLRLWRNLSYKRDHLSDTAKVSRSAFLLESEVPAPLVFLRLAGGGHSVGLIFLAGLALALVLGAGLALGAVVVVAAVVVAAALTTGVLLEDRTGGTFSSSGSYVDSSFSSSCICRACSSSSMTCCSSSQASKGELLVVGSACAAAIAETFSIPGAGASL